MPVEAEQLGMAVAHRVALFVLSFMLALLVLELVRRELLKERYALLWLATAAFGLLVGIFPSIIVILSTTLHFQKLTVLFVLSFLFVLGLVLSFSVAISTLAERNRNLTQEVALLSHELELLKDKHTDEE